MASDVVSVEPGQGDSGAGTVHRPDRPGFVMVMAFALLVTGFMVFVRGMGAARATTDELALLPEWWRGLALLSAWHGLFSIVAGLGLLSGRRVGWWLGIVDGALRLLLAVVSSAFLVGLMKDGLQVGAGSLAFVVVLVLGPALAILLVLTQPRIRQSYGFAV